jgi:hypothetical protein
MSLSGFSSFGFSNIEIKINVIDIESFIGPNLQKIIGINSGDQMP